MKSLIRRIKTFFAKIAKLSCWQWGWIKFDIISTFSDFSKNVFPRLLSLIITAKITVDIFIYIKIDMFKCFLLKQNYFDLLAVLFWQFFAGWSYEFISIGLFFHKLKWFKINWLIFLINYGRESCTKLPIKTTTNPHYP